MILMVLCTGGQQYVCTRCLTCFQHPNTLKSHIMWHCRPVSPSTATIGDEPLSGRHMTPVARTMPPPMHAVRYGEMVATMEKLQDALRQQYIKRQQLTFGDVVGPFRPFFLPALPGVHLHVTDCRHSITTTSPGYVNDCPTLTIHHTCEPRPTSIAVDRHRLKQLSGCLDMLESTLPGCLPNTSRMFPDNYEPAVDNSRHTSDAAHKRHLCVYCGKLYSRKYGLKIHLRTHTGYKPLRCRVCERPFGDPSNLNKHERLHATDASAVYRCPHCGKALVRRRDLERHLQSRHPTEARVSSGKDDWTIDVISDD